MSNQISGAGKRPLGLTHLAHRKLIGWLGIALPLLVVVLSKVWPVHGAEWEMLDSISAFYDTSGNAVFVGTLFALALFLFTYGGYEGDLADRVLGKIAGVSALGVAFFPTDTPSHLAALPWWLDWMGTAHYTAAIVLFASFIAFALWIFRRTSATQKTMSAEKRWRNRIFAICGLVMVASVLWAAIAMRADQPIFAPEAVALVAFAISWLVKGRAHDSVIAAIKKT